MIQDECPTCKTPNQRNEICCTMCGKRLPWAVVKAASVEIKPVEPMRRARSLSAIEKIKIPRSGASIILGLLALVVVGVVIKRNLPVAAVFDIPALVDKPIDEVQAKLGAPYSKNATIHLMPEFTTTSHKMIWKRGNVKLTAHFDKQTGKVNAFHLTTDDPSGETEDKTRILALGNLQDGDMGVLRYSVEFVAGDDFSKYSGVNVHVYS